MHFSPKTLTLCASLFAVLIGCSPVAESQTFRERLLERRSQGGAAAGVSRGNASLPANTEAVTLSVGGVQRQFYVHTPPNRPARAPVLLTLHGGGGSAGRFLNSVPVISHSDREGFIAVFPDGYEGNWNDGRDSFAGRPDDIAFMRAIVDWLVQNAGADRSRVYATGISNGGSMSLRLGCEAPDLVAGIAPIATSFKEGKVGECRPGRSLPVVMFNGTADPLVNYAGGKPELEGMLQRAGRSTGETVVAPPQTAAFWARQANCGGPSSRALPDSANDGTTVTLITYACPRDKVALYQINGGGHSWPGGSGGGGRMAQIAGPTTRDIDAVAEMVRFFGL